MFCVGWLTAAPALAQDQITPDVLKKAKKATVYLRVTLAGNRVLEGSGFFGGAKNVVITNAHVLGMLSHNGRPPQKIEVVVDSGEPMEKKFTGRLLQVDPGADLAAIHVPGADVPDPLPLGLGKDLLETQSLYIFGFPFGKQLGKNITVSGTTVSSLRKNPNGSLRDIQVNGGMNPGNSGGPVIDAKGKAVGVSVAIVTGTQINFAIPGETVLSFLQARMEGRSWQSPYQEGDVKKMPVIYNMVDPLLTIDKVFVETWTGKAGPDRAPNLKTGVVPQPEDGPKTKLQLTYKDRSATGDVVLPEAAKGQVLWLQLSFVRRNGNITYQSAQAYGYKFAPVERKPVTIAFEHRPESPSKLTITATTDLKLRALDGTDKHLVTEIKAELIECQIDKVAKDGAAPVLLTFNSLTVKRTFDKEDVMDKDLANSLKLAKAIAALVRVDKQGDIDILKLVINVKNPAVREDLGLYSIQVLQYLEAVTAPLPGIEVVHEKPWKTKREISLGAGRSAEPGILDVTCKLHGMRETDKKKEAVVFMKGEVKGKGEGLSASGRMTGQATIDLKTNQVRFADANLNLDLDLPTGRGESFQANGTLKIVLTRKPLEGQELVDVLKERTGKSPSPKTKTPTETTKETTPAVPAVKPIPGELFSFLKQSVKDNKLTSVDIKGSTKTKKTYRDAYEDGGVLIGLQAGMGKIGKNPIVNAFRPIYLTKDGEKMGAWIGKAPAEPITIKAKDGYVVSAVSLRAGLLIDGFSLSFAKLGKDRLQLDDTYDSDWTGGTGGNPQRIGGRGTLFAGIVGNLNNGGAPVSLGLLTPTLPGE